MPYPVIYTKSSSVVEEDLIFAVFGSKYGFSTIRLYIAEFIDDSYQLNHILSKYYNLIRKVIASTTPIGNEYEFSIDVIFNREVDAVLLSEWSVIFTSNQDEIRVDSQLQSELESKLKPINISTHSRVTHHDKVVNDDKSTQSFHKQSFCTVAVGGTFDHLHDGHKILLSMALFLTKKKLIIGITGEELLVKKKFHDQIEPFEVRQAAVLEFLAKLNTSPYVTFEIYKITDVCGPTGFVREIDALVLSNETASGGEFVNNYRVNQGFDPLPVIAIDVIGQDGGDKSNNWKGKLSSTDIRAIQSQRNQQLHASNVNHNGDQSKRVKRE